MSEEQPKSVLLAIEALDGLLYVEVTGLAARHERFNASRQNLQEGLTQGDLLRELSSLAERAGVSLMNHRVSPKNSSRDLVVMIRAIQHSRTAEKALIRLQALFEIAGETEIGELLRSPELPEVRNYIGSVIENLDERSEEARQELKAALSPAAAYLLVPDPV